MVEPKLQQSPELKGMENNQSEDGQHTHDEGKWNSCNDGPNFLGHDKSYERGLGLPCSIGMPLGVQAT
jgi:hypothetical protein